MTRQETRLRLRWHYGVKYGSALLLVVSLLGILARTPHSMAQDNLTRIQILDVVDQTFPKTELRVAVHDETGPRAGLTVADFFILEEVTAIPVPIEFIAVEPVTDVPIKLILAIDLSMKDYEWTAMQAAAKVFIDALGPHDQVLLMAYYDQVDLITTEFSADKAMLQQKIDALVSLGDYTNFTSAVVEATGKLSNTPPERQAIVMLTNSGDNLNELTIPEMVNIVTAAEIPVYTVGLPHDRTTALTPLSTTSGGEITVVQRPTDLAAALTKLASRLHEGAYRVSFQSRLRADDQLHPLAIGVNYPGHQTQQETALTAYRQPITVTLHQLNETASPFDLINLGFEADGPTAIVTATYFLEDQPLTERITPPFEYAWNPLSQLPGEYRLEVVVTDRASNTGRDSLTVAVPNPVQASIEVSEHTVFVGDEVTVGANVESVTQIKEVQFMVQHEVFATDPVKPYFAVYTPPANQPPDQRIFTVKAVDTMGREAMSSLEVSFVSRPVPTATATPVPPPATPWRKALGNNWPVWLLFIISILGIISLLSHGLFVVAMIIDRHKQALVQTVQLGVTNTGNVQDAYEVRAESVTNDLLFKFSLNGTSLVPVTPLQPDPSLAPTRLAQAEYDYDDGAYAYEEIPVNGHERFYAEERGVAQAPPPVQQADPNQQDPQDQPDRKKTGQQVGQVAGQAMQTGGVIAGIMNSLASILPQGMGGGALRQVGTHYQRAQSRVQQAQQLKNRAADLLPQGQPNQAEGAPAYATGEAELPSPRPETIVASQSPAAPPRSSAQRTMTRSEPTEPDTAAVVATQMAYQTLYDPQAGWTAVPEPLECGETVLLDLSVAPRNAYRTQTYPFKIHSRTQPLDDKFFDPHAFDGKSFDSRLFNEATPTAPEMVDDIITESQRGELHFEGIAGWRRLWPWLLYACFVIIIIVVALVLMHLIGMVEGNQYVLSL